MAKPPPLYQPSPIPGAPTPSTPWTSRVNPRTLGAWIAVAVVAVGGLAWLGASSSAEHDARTAAAVAAIVDEARRIPIGASEAQAVAIMGPPDRTGVTSGRILPFLAWRRSEQREIRAEFLGGDRVDRVFVKTFGGEVEEIEVSP